MAKLQITLDGELLDEYRLTRGRVTIGRRRNCDIVLDSPVVSGDHALIERIGTDVYLEDRESTNGTRLNGKPARRHKLRIGDEIAIGRYRLRYCDDAASVQPSFEHTLMMTEVRSGGGQVDTRPPLADPQPAARRIHPAAGVLRILTGAQAGHELTLAKNITTLGKPGLQVASISRRPQGYYLSHIEGAQRPRINDVEIGAAPHKLKDGDRIEFLGASMRFSLPHGD